MEDDLIRRGAVLKLIEDIKCDPEVPKNYGTLLDIMRAVREISTAYDVDKVVEQVREFHGICNKCLNNKNSIATCSTFCDMGKELAVIKSGGID